jgi:hypothetical protein
MPRVAVDLDCQHRLGKGEVDVDLVTRQVDGN